MTVGDDNLQADPNNAKVRELRRAYYAAMSYADDNVGRVLGALNDGQLNGARNLRDSTIVCAWSDHGYSLGEHGLWDKHTNPNPNPNANPNANPNPNPNPNPTQVGQAHQLLHEHAGALDVPRARQDRWRP